MNKALIYNGAVDASLDPIALQIRQALAVTGWEVREFILRDLTIAPCRGCFNCWLKTPGSCIINDNGRDTARAMAQSDLAVFLTPLTFGGYSAELKKALDRLIPNILPFLIKVKGEVHHPMRYSRRQDLLIFGVSPKEPGPMSVGVFTRLAERNAINLHSPRLGVQVLSMEWSPEKREQEIMETIKKAGMDHA